jgi:hypothetical protein
MTRLYTPGIPPYYGGFFRPDHDPPAGCLHIFTVTNLL